MCNVNSNSQIKDNLFNIQCRCDFPRPRVPGEFHIQKRDPGGEGPGDNGATINTLMVGHVGMYVVRCIFNTNNTFVNVIEFVGKAMNITFGNVHNVITESVDVEVFVGNKNEISVRL